LGAQKVRTNFADIEKEAELADKIKFNEPEKTEVEKSNEDKETQVWMINLILLMCNFFILLPSKIKFELILYRCLQ